MLHQCSRDVPSLTEGGWIATPSDLDGLDTLLARRVEAELAASDPIYHVLKSFKFNGPA